MASPALAGSTSPPLGDDGGIEIDAVPPGQFCCYKRDVSALIDFIPAFNEVFHDLAPLWHHLHRVFVAHAQELLIIAPPLAVAKNIAALAMSFQAGITHAQRRKLCAGMKGRRQRIANACQVLFSGLFIGQIQADLDQKELAIIDFAAQDCAIAGGHALRQVVELRDLAGRRESGKIGKGADNHRGGLEEGTSTDLQALAFALDRLHDAVGIACHYTPPRMLITAFCKSSMPSPDCATSFMASSR